MKLRHRKSDALVLAKSRGLNVGKKKHRWKSIGYTVAVVTRRGSASGTHVVDKVIGRAYGMREDGGMYFAVISLPWVWEKKFDWQPLVKDRLDTFLYPFCRCRSNAAGDTIICASHIALNVEWTRQDDLRESRNRTENAMLNRLPAPGAHPGPLSSMKVLHRDYSFIKEDLARHEYVCEICQARGQAYNTDPFAWKLFVNRHSHCAYRPGAVDVTPVPEQAVVDLCIAAIRARDDMSHFAKDSAIAALANVRNGKALMAIAPSRALNGETA